MLESQTLRCREGSQNEMTGEGSILAGNTKSGTMKKAKEEAYNVICNCIKPKFLAEM